MEAFRTHTGIGVPLPRSNVDTDQIIPAVYLKRVTRTGFEDGLFSAWRDDPGFVLNDPAHAGATILVAAAARRLGPAGLGFQGGHRAPLRRHLPGQRAEGGSAAGAAGPEGGGSPV